MRSYTQITSSGQEQPLHHFNPADAFPLPKTSPYHKARYLTPEQARSFLSAIPRNTLQGMRDYALFLAYLATGRCNSEIRLLRWIDHPTLLLVEGEFDAMLCWQLAHDLSDLATLVSASNRLAFPDLAALSLYPHILDVYDSDPAGDLARSYLSQYPRIQFIDPPAHEITDYWRAAGNLCSWLKPILILLTVQ